MKFCYVDESGHGDEPILVIASIVTDAVRMHITKEHWAVILNELSNILNKPISEFRTRHFYRGRGIWHDLDGEQRSRVLDIIIGWLQRRHHKVAFTAIEKAKAKSCVWENKKEYLTKNGKPNYWRLAALHLILCIQKEHQGYDIPKGHTVFIFDNEMREEYRLGVTVLDPPEWSDSFYGHNRKTRRAGPKEPLSQIVDVPYFADSKQVGMLQVADLFAYLLRHYAELEIGYTEAEYSEEKKKVKRWVKGIAKFMLPDSNRWPARGGCECAEFFKNMAPAPLLRIHAESTR